jgi:hypothetical protein
VFWGWGIGTGVCWFSGVACIAYLISLLDFGTVGEVDFLFHNSLILRETVFVSGWLE